MDALDLSRKIASKYFGRKNDWYDDLVSEGLIAYLDCEQRFDPSKGISLTSYAWHRMRGRMQDKVETWAHLRYDVNETPIQYIHEPFPCRQDHDYIDIQEAISHLDNEEKRLLIFYYWHGYSLRELAEPEWVSEVAISSRLKTIRNRLKHYLIDNDVSDHISPKAFEILSGFSCRKQSYWRDKGIIKFHKNGKRIFYVYDEVKHFFKYNPSLSPT